MNAVGIGGFAEEQARGGRRGNGQDAVGHFCGAAADVKSRAGEGFDSENLEANAGADDVNDGVYGADFMEVDFFEWDVVDGGFGFAEFRENGSGADFHAGCERGFLDDF